jgi:ferredoxin
MKTPSNSSTRLHIDWTRCHGRGLCTELLPRILGRDDWGYPIARDGSREPAVPPAALSEAHTAVDLCPRLALSLITDVNPGSGTRKAGTRA